MESSGPAFPPPVPAGLAGPAGPQPAIRVGDRERDAVAHRLQDAFAEGRLDDDEFDQRMRAALTADFCNGISTLLDASQWSFINGDVSINLTRPPVGEWILLDAETWLERDGGGIAFARMGDRAGYFGRAVQSLVIERR